MFLFVKRDYERHDEILRLSWAAFIAREGEMDQEKVIFVMPSYDEKSCRIIYYINQRQHICTLFLVLSKIYKFKLFG